MVADYNAGLFVFGGAIGGLAHFGRRRRLCGIHACQRVLLCVYRGARCAPAGGIRRPGVWGSSAAGSLAPVARGDRRRGFLLLAFHGWPVALPAGDALFWELIS